MYKLLAVLVLYGGLVCGCSALKDAKTLGDKIPVPGLPTVPEK